jgi:hypothetical protein
MSAASLLIPEANNHISHEFTGRENRARPGSKQIKTERRFGVPPR